MSAFSSSPVYSLSGNEHTSHGCFRCIYKLPRLRHLGKSKLLSAELAPGQACGRCGGAQRAVSSAHPCPCWARKPLYFQKMLRGEGRSRGGRGAGMCFGEDALEGAFFFGGCFGDAFERMFLRGCFREGAFTRMLLLVTSCLLATRAPALQPPPPLHRAGG